MAPTAQCPICSAELTLGTSGQFNSWTCPAGHGFAATLSEGYEVAQEDELRRLWQIARDATAPADARKCPMCATPMVSIVAPVDADEAEEGARGDTPDTDEIPVDVCVADQVIWFDTGELDRFPRDLPDPEPTPEQLAALGKIRKHFSDAFDETVAANATMTDRLADRLIRSRGTLGLLARAMERD